MKAAVVLYDVHPDSDPTPAETVGGLPDEDYAGDARQGFVRRSSLLRRGPGLAKHIAEMEEHRPPDIDIDRGSGRAVIGLDVLFELLVDRVGIARQSATTRPTLTRGGP